MSKITYTNKQVASDPANPVSPIEIFSADDANEIKESVNYLYDNEPDLSGYIKNLPSYGSETQSASINIDGGISLSSNGAFTSLFAGGASMGNDNGSIVLQLAGIQTNSSIGTLIINNDKLFSYQNSGGLAYELTPGFLKLTNGLVSRKIELPNTATGDYTNQFPNKDGVLATLNDIPAAPDLSTYISMYGNQEQTGYLTLRNWLNLKAISSWQQGIGNGNISYSTTDKWVFMNQAGAGKNIGFEFLPSETYTVIRLKMPITGGTIARLEDLPNTSSFAQSSDLNAFVKIDDLPLYVDITGKTNKTETATVGSSQKNFAANINNGFIFGITNDAYMGDTKSSINNYSIAVSSEKREAGYGNLEKGKKLTLTQYSDGLIFNQNLSGKNNQLCVSFPDYSTENGTGAHLYFPASQTDGTLTVLSAVTNAPASATASGVKGEVIVTGGYRYECTSNNVWVRCAIETTW